VAIQMDCFVVPPGGPPRNDSLFVKGRWFDVNFARAVRTSAGGRRGKGNPALPAFDG